MAVLVKRLPGFMAAPIKRCDYGLQKKFWIVTMWRRFCGKTHLTAEQIAGDVAELLCSESK